jgi:hypothetical protein
MPIPVVCACTAKLKVGDHLQGKHIKCPKCGSLIAVGGPNGHPAAPAPAARPKADLLSPHEVLEQSTLSPQERERLEGELDSGERLLWAGKPSARVAFIHGWLAAAGLYSGAVMLLVILLVMNGTGALRDTGGLILLLLLVLGIVGLVAAGSAVPFVKRWYKRLTTYAVTNKRALAWVPDWFGKVKFVSYDPGDMAKLYRVQVSTLEGGVGNLIFGSFHKDKKTKEGIERTTYIYGFWLVPEAARIEKLMREHLVDPLLDRLYEEEA